MGSPRQTIYQGDSAEVLKHVPDGSVHLTFTSPPYFNARGYSTYTSYQSYLQKIKDVCEQVFRVTQEGRFLVINTSPVLTPRESRSKQSVRHGIPYDLHPILIQMGWDFIDDIVWVKPEASVKNRNGSFFQHRKPIAYKPNAVTEMVMVYRKHTDRLIDWNIAQYDDQIVSSSLVPDGYPTQNVWHIPPRSDADHSAVFPHELCRRVISLYSFKNDMVLDPFAGIGTVGEAAVSLGRGFTLIERDPEYFTCIKSWVDNTCK